MLNIEMTVMKAVSEYKVATLKKTVMVSFLSDGSVIIKATNEPHEFWPKKDPLWVYERAIAKLTEGN